MLTAIQRHPPSFRTRGHPRQPEERRDKGVGILLRLKAEGKPESPFDGCHLGTGKDSKAFFERVLRYCRDGVEIDDTFTWHAIFRAEGDLDRTASNTGRHWRDGDELSDLIGLVTGQENHRAAAGWPGELSPPDLASLHSQGSAARTFEDAARAASTSSAVSGCVE